ncbi:hypothetical protein QOT17_025158 [Balamuthia mandrillaris]
MQLIVRECYPRIFELSQRLAKQTIGGSGGVVFSGNPGIGKSWFLNYTLWRLLQQNKTVLVESVAQARVWLFKEGQVREAPFEDKKQIVELFETVRNDTDAWYLFDPCGDIPREPKEMLPFTVVAASPNPQHYKQFYKRTANKYYIPCWSWEELKMHVPHAAQTVAPGLTMDEAYDHFKIFGGIPRYVYRTSEQAKRTKRELDGKIQQLDMRALSLVLNDLEMIRYYQGRLSYQVLQYEVDPETFESKGIRYASDYVGDAIYEQKLKNNQSELGRAIHELKGALAGEIFERYATSRLAPGGCFRIYPLHPAGGKAAWLRMPARSKTSYVGSLREMKEWEEVGAEEILKCAPNFPVIDALSEEGAFNFTVTKRHGIKPQPCKELLTKLGVGKDKPLKLYWVLRDGEGQDFPKQQFTNPPPNNTQPSQQKRGGGGGEDNDFIEARLHQFALELPTLHYASMNKSELQDLCAKKGLATSGTNSELIYRLEGKE